jgi:hypothetical protein
MGRLFGVLVRPVYFIYSLFNDLFSNSDYIVSNVHMQVNVKLEKMWKEVIMA